MIGEHKFQITGEESFEDLTGHFSIAPSSGDYTLQCSDEKNGVFSDEVLVKAGDRLKFSSVVRGLFYRCSGNTDTLKVVMTD